MKYLDDNGLLYLIQKIKTWLAVKVDKVDGKGLSTNDLTNDLKAKYDTAVQKVDELTETGGAPNVIEIVKVNGTPLVPDSNKAVDVSVPTNNNQLTNGAGYQTEAQVNTLIANGIAGIQGISYSVVANLPATGQAGIIYLVSNNGANPNIYDEYIYVNGKFEKIGTTDIDLSGYVEFTDLVAITNTEIDTLIA